MIPMLDLIVGNTCVLIDRDPSNIARRKVYGKAGEHRTPKHGIEYRTPSNFWLKSPELMSMITSLANLAVVLTANSKNDTQITKDLFSKLKFRHVVEAINNNDFELAYANFKAIEPVLHGLCSIYFEYPINSCHSKEFHHFIKKGTDYWFKRSPMKAWSDLSVGSNSSFEQFLRTTVRADMKRI
jgi:hypothetical protein